MAGSVRLPVDLACGLIGLAAALLAVAATVGVHGGSLSVLVHMSASDGLAQIAQADPRFVFVPNHYDGVFFYAIALDPLATGRAHELIDLGANRYGHPAYGWAAGLLALGRPELLPFTMLLIALGSLFVGSIAASRLFASIGATPWGGLAVALNPGFVYAVTVVTSEAFGAALLMASLLAWLTGRRLLAAVLFVPLCFSKEILVLVPVGLGAWEAWRVFRGGSRGEFLRSVALLAPGPVLYAAWYAYVRSRFGIWPFEAFDPGLPGLGPPLVGWVDSLLMGARMASSGFLESQLGQVIVPFVATALVAIVIGIARAVRWRSPLDPVYLLFAGLTLCLAWAAMMFPKEFIRNLSFTFLMLALVAYRPRFLASSTMSPDEGPTPSRGTEADAQPRGDQ